MKKKKIEKQLYICVSEINKTSLKLWLHLIRFRYNIVSCHIECFDFVKFLLCIFLFLLLLKNGVVVCILNFAGIIIIIV